MDSYTSYLFASFFYRFTNEPVAFQGLIRSVHFIVVAITAMVFTESIIASKVFSKD